MFLCTFFPFVIILINWHILKLYQNKRNGDVFIIKNIIYKSIFHHDFFYDGKSCHPLNLVAKWHTNTLTTMAFPEIMFHISVIYDNMIVYKTNFCVGLADNIVIIYLFGTFPFEMNQQLAEGKERKMRPLVVKLRIIGWRFGRERHTGLIAQ